MFLSATAFYSGVLVLVTLAAVLAFVLQRRSLRRRRRVRMEDDDAPEVFRDMPLVMRPRNITPFAPQPTPPSQPAAAPTPQRLPVPQSSAPSPVQRAAPKPMPAPVFLAQAAAAMFNAANAPPQSDEPLQMLAGRLEPLNPGVHQEIRFVKTAGVDRFTLGRSSGPLYSHIQLTAPTASRLHAYMRPDKGRWHIGNLSTTNPLLINGTRLRTEDGERLLEDGDRIELGEIVFVFRDR